MSLTPVARAGAAAPARPAADRRQARRSAAWRRRRLVLLLMSPWIVGFLVFIAYPLVMSVYLSFTHYDLLNPPRWIGTANYRYMFGSDNQIWPAIRNTLWIIVVGVPLQVLFAFGISVMLTRARRGVGFFRTVFYLPALAPPVAAALGFVFLLNPATGPVNTLLGKIGIDGPLWFNDPSWAKPSLVMLSLWGIGNTMIIFLAAVLDVPRHLVRVGGARRRGTVPAAALGDAAVDQPRDPLRRRARRDPGAAVLHAGVRRGDASRPDRRRRRAARATSSSATRRARRSSTPSSSTTTASSTSTWATPPRWRSCCSACRSR